VRKAARPGYPDADVQRLPAHQNKRTARIVILEVVRDARKALSGVFKRARLRQDSEVVIDMDAVADAKKIRSGFSITCDDAEKMT